MRKKIICCLPLLMSVFISIAQFSDNFTDGDYTNNPTWTPGGATDWVVTNEQLQSNNQTTNSTFYITTPNSLATTAEWDFYANLKFATSGSNYVDVFLTASANDISAAATTGYFVRIGNTKDEICLYRKDGASSSLLIDGVDGAVSSSNNSIRIKVTRDANNQFVLSRDLAGGTSYTSEGLATDATYTTSSFFGILVKQSTASFFQKHFFDDIVVQAYVPDVTPPTIQSSTVTSSTTADVLFNEVLDAVSAQNVSNYSANNSLGAPASAVLDGSNTALVHLTFAAGFADGVINTLTVNNVKDISGNAISNGTATFTYFAPYTAQAYDVVIDEIMADQTPQVSLPNNEWLELKNTSTHAINIQNWKINGSGDLPNFTLQPDSFVIVCTGSAVPGLSAFGTTVSVTNFPSLTDGGKLLTLTDNNGNVMHSVNYSSAWYNDNTKAQGGWTLEMINTKSPCLGASNWTASNDSKGGTPGAINSVNNTVPDITAPKLTKAIVVDDMNVKLVFDKKLDSTKAATITNYSISDGMGNPITATPLTPGFDTVLIQLPSAATSAKQYTVTVNNITDCIGNTITANATTTFTYYAPYFAHQYDVVIDEIMSDPDPQISLPNTEWIELKNTTSQAINLQGWRIADASGQSGAMPSFILAPGAYVILCTSSAVPDLSAYGDVLAVSSFPSLNNTGELLTLIDNNGATIHAVDYSTDWYGDDTKKDGGWTLEMINPLSPCSGASNWTASVDPRGGTPGTINSVNGGTGDKTGPQLTSSFVNDPTHLVVNFNESLDSTIAANISNYVITNNIGIASALPVGPLFNAVNITLNSPLVAGTEYTITANGITDCLGNLIGSVNSAKVLVASAVAPFDLVVNEILYNPIPSINLQPSGVDYVEIYNRSNKVIDLSAVYIANRSSTTGAIGSVQKLSATSRLLLPQQYIVATSTPSIVRRDFVVKDTTAFVTVSSMPSFPDNEGYVILCTQDLSIIDEVDYTDKWQFPLISNTEGVALERINPDDTTLPQPSKNWHSAATSVGYGTPTYKNSQYGTDLQVQGSITVSPKIFSPDNDGQDDFAIINYEFPEPGYTMNITIFDAQGREVLKSRPILNGIKGYLQWDGLGKSYNKLPVGIYIIYTEVFNLQGKVQQFKNTIVLARRNN